MKKTKILGTGKYVPKKVVTNEELEKFVETSDEWIYTRTGIKERRIAVEETSYDMAIYAAEDALKSSGVLGEDIDLIIVATVTCEYAFPSIACLVQKAIGAKNAMAFDISAACSGAVFALQVADQHIKTGCYKNALVIGAEKLSHIVNWEDRSTCVLFGDGAGAILLGKCEEEDDDKGIIGCLCKSSGEDSDCLIAGLGRSKTPFYEEKVIPPYIEMSGRELMEFVNKKVPKLIEDLLEFEGITKDEVDYYILHQANIRIISSVAKKLGEDMSKFYTNIEKYGNTSAASVVIALDEMVKSGVLDGKTVVLCAFGAGLTYGASIMRF